MPTIHGITYDDLGRLGVDEANRLYWDGRPLVTEERVTLTWWVNVALIVGAASTLVLAIIGVLSFFGFGAATSP